VRLPRAKIGDLLLNVECEREAGLWENWHTPSIKSVRPRGG
jgi:hypothetical protein